MNNYISILVFLFVILRLNAQNTHVNLSIMQNSMFFQSPGTTFFNYSVNYDNDFGSSWFWDYSSFYGLEGEYHHNRFSFDTGIFGYGYDVRFTGINLDQNYRYQLSYNENRIFLGLKVGAGYNFFDPESNSKLLMKVSFFFDKRISGEIIEDGIIKINRNSNEVVEKLSAVQEYGIYNPIIIRPFIFLEYQYTFRSSFVFGVNIGLHPNGTPRTGFRLESDGEMGYSYYRNIFTAGLKLGYVFPMKAKE